MLPGAVKDPQVVTPEWQRLQPRIDGVTIREVLHVPRDHGVITETYRPEWDPTGSPIVHIYQSRLFPGAIGAWSCHARTIDRLFVNQGHLKVGPAARNLIREQRPAGGARSDQTPPGASGASTASALTRSDSRSRTSRAHSVLRA